MSDKIAHLLDRLRELEKDIDREVEEQRLATGATLKAGASRFSEEMRAQHRTLKIGLVAYIRGSSLPLLLTVPLTYAIVAPLLLLDLLATLHQQICFRVYGIARVRRSDYIALDRHRLGYLNGIEKLNCLYCGYANGVIAYAREIASRTEQYWCPIKHARTLRSPHRRYSRFLAYGDAQGYRDNLADLRRTIDRL